MIPGSVGQRGKWAEGKVAALLKLYEAYSSFSWYRLPDARAGSLKATLADIQTMHRAQFRLLEIKETQHTHRLPHKNFSEDKVARIRAWAMAGAEASVIIAFRPPEKPVVWRVAPIERFITKEGGSWDLSDLPALQLKDLLETIYGPLPPKRA